MNEKRFHPTAPQTNDIIDLCSSIDDDSVTFCGVGCIATPERKSTESSKKSIRNAIEYPSYEKYIEDTKCCYPIAQYLNNAKKSAYEDTNLMDAGISQSCSISEEIFSISNKKSDILATYSIGETKSFVLEKHLYYLNNPIFHGIKSKIFNPLFEEFLTEALQITKGDPELVQYNRLDEYPDYTDDVDDISANENIYKVLINVSTKKN